jgi:hypothetical protein
MFVRSWRLLVLAGLILLVLVLAGLMLLPIGCKDSRPPRVEPPPPAPEPDLSVPAEQLARDYRKDPAAADARYKNKLLQVEGKIHEVFITEIPGEALVVLWGGRDKDADMPTLIQCGFVNTQPVPPATLTSLKKDQAITIRGTCIGSFATTVLIQDALVVPRPKS